MSKMVAFSGIWSVRIKPWNGRCKSMMVIITIQSRADRTKVLQVKFYPSIPE